MKELRRCKIKGCGIRRLRALASLGDEMKKKELKQDSFGVFPVKLIS